MYLQDHAFSFFMYIHERAKDLTVILEPDFLNNLVHAPAVQVVVADDFERQSVLLLIPFDGLERVVTVSRNALINRQQEKIQAIVVLLVQFLHHIRQHGRVFFQ